MASLHQNPVLECWKLVSTPITTDHTANECPSCRFKLVTEQCLGGVSQVEYPRAPLHQTPVLDCWKLVSTPITTDHTANECPIFGFKLVTELCLPICTVKGKNIWLIWKWLMTVYCTSSV